MVGLTFKQPHPADCRYCTFWTVHRFGIPGNAKTAKTPREPKTPKGILHFKQQFFGNDEKGTTSIKSGKLSLAPHSQIFFENASYGDASKKILSTTPAAQNRETLDKSDSNTIVNRILPTDRKRSVDSHESRPTGIDQKVVDGHCMETNLNGVAKAVLNGDQGQDRVEKTSDPLCVDDHAKNNTLDSEPSEKLLPHSSRVLEEVSLIKGCEAKAEESKEEEKKDDAAVPAPAEKQEETAPAAQEEKVEEAPAPAAAPIVEAKKEEVAPAKEEPKEETPAAEEPTEHTQESKVEAEEPAAAPAEETKEETEVEAAPAEQSAGTPAAEPVKEEKAEKTEAEEKKVEE